MPLLHNYLIIVTIRKIYKYLFSKKDMETLNTISIDDALENADICLYHTSLNRRELQKSREEQNPSCECAVCGGYNCNCPAYHSLGSPIID